MMVDQLTIRLARTLVAKALAVSEDRIGPESTMFELSCWDSFGQLSVVLAIEEEFGTRIEDEATFNRLVSVLGIAAYLADLAGQTAP